MKFFILCLFAISCVEAYNFLLTKHGMPPPDIPHKRSVDPTWHTIIQRLDHFNSSDTRIWSMRYVVNDQFYVDGGPIFLLIGAEWTIDKGSLQSGQIFDMAEEHNGIMFYTEHRYYGYSYPTQDFSTSNLRYLSVDQALADIASFINQIKTERPYLANSKVVVIGGSYGGTMATWMRERYPKLIHAAYASSAPLVATYDFVQYNQVIQKDLGARCAAVVTNGINYTLDLIRQGRITKINNDFYLCDSLNTSTYDPENLIASISSKINNQVQYAQSQTIDNICSNLFRGGYSDYDSLVNYVRSSDYCIPNYRSLVQYFSKTELNARGERPWFYQTCTEFGFFQTSEDYSSLYSYGIPVTYYQQICLDLFGSSFTSSNTQNGIQKTNMKYGGLNPNITRVISVHGTVDPWHSIGLSESDNRLAPVIIVPGSSHCADMSSPSRYDSTELYNAKMAVRQYIASWLNEE